jgi:hypothetical protein
MASIDLLPTSDWQNQGWTVVGATKAFDVLDDDSDSTYVKNPSSKGSFTVAFPQDITSLPAGAKIDSVTVYARLAKTVSSMRSITFKVLSKDKTSCYYTRSIYPSQTPTQYEIGTFRRDPRGNHWDVHRLNKFLIGAFSYCMAADNIRIYKFFCRVNFRYSPSVTVTGPTGTVNTPSPTITWTYNQTDGDQQVAADYKIFTAVQRAASNFDPEKTPAVIAGKVLGEIESVTSTDSLNPDSYYVYVRGKSHFGVYSPWAFKTFTVQGPSPGIPIEDGAFGAGSGAATISVVPDTFNSAAFLQFRDASNLMSVGHAGLESPADPVEYTATNATLSRTTATFYGPGVGALSMVGAGSGNMSATSTIIECAEGVPVTVRAQFRKATSGSRTVNIYARFYDASYTEIAASAISGTATTLSTTWTEATATGTTPLGTVYAKVQCEVVSVVSTETHYVDHVGLMYGTDVPWSDGGHMSRNLLTSHVATGDDPAASNTWTLANLATTVSRVAVTGTGSSGVKMNRMTYSGVAASLGYRATGTAFSSPTSGTDYTLNKPAGVVDGDLLLAFVTSTEAGAIDPPSGWELVNTGSLDNASDDIAMWVLKRTGLAADPATWVGAVSTSSSRRRAIVVAYSGAALADSQFVVENVRTDATGSLVHTSATVNNTDPNAWRVSAFAFRDDATGGTVVANKDAPSTAGAPPIQFVSVASKWSQGTSGSTSYTINRPANIQSGDLMIAFVAIGNEIGTVTPPSGWTLVRKIAQADSSYANTLAVLKRTAGSSEPASWTGSLSFSATPVITTVMAYRNCDTAANQFIAENGTQSGSGSSITTATVNNTNSTSWRIAAFSASASDAPSWTASTDKERFDSYVIRQSNEDVGLAIYDSNGSISTGNTSRSATLNQSYFSAESWIGIIKGLDPAQVPPPGANETERSDATTGSADPWLTTAVYDSNGVVPTGNMSVTGVFTPGSGTTVDASASWVGILKPGNAAAAGVVAAQTTETVDISLIDPEVLRLSGGKITMTAAFLGSAAGTPFLRLDSYRANQLISSQIAEGVPFETSVWTKSTAVFDLPEGTTRIRPVLFADDRAINDQVNFDRVGVSLGSSLVWRNGTGRDEHPVWTSPVIQYADDDGTGYGPWQDLAGLKANPPVFDPLTGVSQYMDHTIVPLVSRKYRVKNISYGLLGDKFVSPYGAESMEVSVAAANWWLKDIHDPSSNLELRVRAAPLTVGTTNTSAVFQPLGEQYPVVLTEGYKGEAVELTLICYRDEFAALRKLLKSGRTLYLQSDMDNAWWVRPVGDLESETQLTGKRRTDPLRFVKVTFVQVAPEV